MSLSNFSCYQLIVAGWLFSAVKMCRLYRLNWRIQSAAVDERFEIDSSRPMS
jgi:hypothetical protein